MRQRSIRSRGVRRTSSTTAAATSERTRISDRVGGRDVLVLVGRLPLVRLGREHRCTRTRERDHHGEDLEGEDHAEEQRDLDRRLQHRQDHVADALEEAAPNTSAAST